MNSAVKLLTCKMEHVASRHQARQQALTEQLQAENQSWQNKHHRTPLYASVTFDLVTYVLTHSFTYEASKKDTAKAVPSVLLDTCYFFK